MKLMINQLKKPRAACLGVFAALALSLDTNAVPYTNFLSIARSATYLVSAPLTDTQVQTLHASELLSAPDVIAAAVPARCLISDRRGRGSPGTGGGIRFIGVSPSRLG